MSKRRQTRAIGLVGMFQSLAGYIRDAGPARPFDPLGEHAVPLRLIPVFKTLGAAHYLYSDLSCNLLRVALIKGFWEGANPPIGDSFAPEPSFL
jgi:hypothetical protein